MALYPDSLYDFPNVSAYDSDLREVLAMLRGLTHEMRDFTVVNKITNAGAWDITKQYKPWTIVSDNNIGYISVRPVPAGIEITNTDYWALVADYDILITNLSERISALESDNIINKEQIEKNKNSIKSIFVNVRDYGAAGDGVTDDTLAFNAAVAACANADNKTLYVPVGTYLISGITIPSGFVRFNILGESTARSILKFTGNTCIDMSGGSGFLCDNSVKNITIIHSSEAISDDVIGIRCTGTCGVNIESVHFNYCDKAILCNNTQANFTECVVARKCSFVTNNYAMYLKTDQGATQYSYHGCGLEDCYITDHKKNAVYVDENCFLYNAPLDFTIWSDGSYSFVYLNAAAAYSNNTKSLIAHGHIKYEVTGTTQPTIFDASAAANRIFYMGTIEGIGADSLYILGSHAYIADSAVMYRDASLGLDRAHRKVALASPAPGTPIYNAPYHIHKIYYILNGPNYWELGYFYVVNSHISRSVEDKTVLQRYAPGSDNITFTNTSGNLSYVLNSGATLTSLTLSDSVEIQ